MRRFFKWLLVALMAGSVLLAAGCPKKANVKDSKEEGEEQPDPGGKGIPQPGVL